MSKPKEKVIKYKRKTAKPRASTSVLIKREEEKLRRLRNQEKLLKIRQEVKELQELIKRGY